MHEYPQVAMTMHMQSQQFCLAGYTPTVVVTDRKSCGQWGGGDTQGQNHG